jgi:hypothetical protein
MQSSLSSRRLRASWAVLPLAALPLAPSEPGRAPDWLVDPTPFVARVVERDGGAELALENGLVRRVIRLAPNAATIALDQLTSGQAILRAVEPEAALVLDGVRWEVGGLAGQPDRAWLDPRWIDGLRADERAFRCVGPAEGPIEPRLEWKRVRHSAPDAVWPPRGRHVRLDFEPPRVPAAAALAGLRVEVHHEVYDGLPLVSKWIEVVNGTDHPVRLDAFECERLAAVERGSWVGGPAELLPHPDLVVDCDYAFGGGMASSDALREVVRWVSDPQYATQVHYERQTPCLLVVGPRVGPGLVLAPGARFASCRAYLLACDSTERERQGLAVRRMYRTLAPWVTENPLVMHVRSAAPDVVRAAIDQCAAVGFEMVILSFGSGFDAEDRSQANLERLAELAAHARSRGVELGGYSLLASRSVGPADDVVMPPGRTPIFGNSPCLQSAWGRRYFDTLRGLFEATGMTLLEHDGSYPGDVCAATAHPGHAGLDDSQWTQWAEIRDFYGWCRARGVYLNVPDWYYLTGSNKCGMGYRETNWSLPRAQQVIHTRQNIYDGTWEKTPSQGWMFVPLTEYQGGGAAATIEPLDEHIDHYEGMLVSNLALGVQACYRGPRLYDTDRTKAMLQRWVGWYRRYRDILESDLIHGRRADGRDVDWMLHVNPRLDPCAMLVAFNPLDRDLERELDVDLQFTGLAGAALAEADGAEPQRIELDSRGRARVRVRVPAAGFTWIALRRP